MRSNLSTFIALPKGIIKVSAEFDEGFIGGIFHNVILRCFAKSSIAVVLNGGPLSYNCTVGLPYVSYIFPRIGNTLSAFVDETSFAIGKRLAKSCATTTCFDDGISPNKSTATVSQFLAGT